MSARVAMRLAAPPAHEHRTSLRVQDADDGRFSGSIAAAVQRLLVSLPTPPRARAGNELEGATTPSDDPTHDDASGARATGKQRGEVTATFGILADVIDHLAIDHPSLDPASSKHATVDPRGAEHEDVAHPSTEPSATKPSIGGELALATFTLADASIAIASQPANAPLPPISMQMPALTSSASSPLAPLDAAPVSSSSPKKTLPGVAPPASSTTDRAKTRDRAHSEDEAAPSAPTEHARRAEPSPAHARHASSTHHAASSADTRTSSITATMGAVRSTDVRAIPIADRPAVRIAPPAPIAEPDPEPSLPEPPASAVHYGAIESDDAHVELSHPTLGRVDLDVHHDAGRYDVSLVTRSMGASIALRAAEESLRVDMRARSTELRGYRVRTDAGRRDPRATNDDEENRS